MDMSENVGESSDTITMVRLPTHALRRPSAVPASDLSPVHPHPTGSPPPDFSPVNELDRAEKDLGAGSIAVTREADPDAPPAPAYSPPRSRSVASGQRQSISYTGARGTRPQGDDIEMGWREMWQMVVDDYYATKQFVKHMKWKEVWVKVIARSMFKWYLIIAIAITLTVLVTTQHDKVVHWCAPITRTIRDWPGGWLIPLALLIIVSYPPLVGHEIIGILIGLVWGLGQGFAILAAGTFIGEILLWFSFKWCCTGAASRFEKKNKLYWSLTQLIREKTFMFVLILRFSAIPGHIVTAVSASAGANYWSYLAAAFLTLPKQFTIVYLGSAFGHKERKHVIISTVTMITTIVVTGVAAVYIYYQMRMVMRRRARELAEALPSHQGDLAMVETCPATATGVTPAWNNGRQGDGDLEVYVPDLAKDDMKGLAARRPWLFTNPSLGPSAYGGNASTRTWSVPHHMTEAEMREFRTEMEASGTNTPAVRVGTDEEPPVFGSPFTDASPSTSPTRTRFSSLPLQYIPQAERERPTERDWDLLVPPTARDSSARVSTSSDRSNSPRLTGRRGSLDLARPIVPGTTGGREIADDADMYAFERGGRRPDFSRMRGESRAALLGRPTDDASSVKSGKGSP